MRQPDMDCEAELDYIGDKMEQSQVCEDPNNPAFKACKEACDEIKWAEAFLDKIVENLHKKGQDLVKARTSIL